MQRTGPHTPGRRPRTMPAPLLAAVLVFLVHTPSPARAWGGLGHRLVARVAERHLTDRARAGVRGLLDRGESIADASTYADDHKREILGSAPWHYVNVPLDEEKYRDEFCGAKGCVVGKIKEVADVLRDRSKPRKERQMALRFVIHLVGDVHQPLHVGDNRDRGGNDLQVQFFGEGSNLHRVWDFGLIEKAGRDEDAWLETLAALDTDENRAKYRKGDAKSWADESLAAARKAYQVPGTDRRVRPGEKLGQEYFDANLPVARLRLYQAGVRLARVLNEAFKD